MRLTVIPSGGLVSKDSLAFDELVWDGTPLDVHALQWYDSVGWIEYTASSKPNEEITALPNWANNALAAWSVANEPRPIPPATAEDNKNSAIFLLNSTDWATIADVSNPLLSNPYLTNASDFIAFRNIVRPIAVTPVAGDLVWPAKPDAVWA
jgi:hypothetical protein